MMPVSVESDVARPRESRRSVPETLPEHRIGYQWLFPTQVREPFGRFVALLRPDRFFLSDSYLRGGFDDSELVESEQCTTGGLQL